MKIKFINRETLILAITLAVLAGLVVTFKIRRIIEEKKSKTDCNRKS